MDRGAARSTAPSDLASLPWTATRCHRLLRPLLTHVTALRKEVKRQHPIQSLGEDLSRGNGVECGPGSDLKKPHKRVRRTYSLKASKRATPRVIGEVESEEGKHSRTGRHVVPPEPCMYLATPIVRRIRGQWSSPLVPEPVIPEAAGAARPGRCYHAREVCAKRCFFEDRLAALRKTTEPSTFALCESIYRALDALLRATSASEAQSARPKNLLAMCLRKVPDYLAELESWRLQQLEENRTGTAANDSSMSFDLYSDLESLGTGKSGWKHLATVVQSHGISIVKNAISEHLLADDFAVLLVQLCSQCKALDDRRQLLEAVLKREQRNPFGPDHDLCYAWPNSSPALGLLLHSRDSRDQTGERQYKARLAADLLSNQLLPQEWVLTRDFGCIWSVAMKDLTSRNAHPETMPFFITSIQVFCKHIQQKGRTPLSKERPVTTAHQLLVNSLATLATLAILGQETLATGQIGRAHV